MSAIETESAPKAPAIRVVSGNSSPMKRTGDSAIVCILHITGRIFIVPSIIKLTIVMMAFVTIFGGKLIFSQSNCPNSDFSMGNFTNWEGFYGDFYDPAQYSGFVPDRHVILTEPGYFDSNTNGLFTLPEGESFAARLGNQNVGAEAEQLRYSLTVTPETNLFIYKYAVVLEDPGHVPEHQPSFTIEVTDEDGELVDPVCGYYYVYAQQGMPGWTTYGSVVWKDWTIVGLNLDEYMGQNVTIVFTTRDCEQTGHFGYAYLSASCGKLQMLVSYCPQSTSATLTAPSGFSYLWNTGQTSQSIMINNPVSGDQYSCELTAVNGCKVTVYASVYPTYVNADFAFTANCVGLPVYFSDLSTVNQNEITGWKWNFDDGSQVLTGEADPEHIYTSPGNYNVKLIAFSSGGCNDTIVKTIGVFPKPSSDFTYTPQCLYNSVPFTDLSSISQASITDWEWDFGDGTMVLNGIASPGHTFSNAGTYNVQLVTYSSDACSDTVLKPVVVYPAPQIQLFRDGSLITADTMILCPLDSTAVLSVNNCGTEYEWTRKTEPNWSSSEQSVFLSNPGMGFFVESYYLKVTNEYECISRDTVHLLWDFAGCVGIEESEKLILGVFPNPTDGMLYINFDPAVKTMEVELYNVFGKPVLRREFNYLDTGQIRLDLSAYDRGVWFLNIRTSENTETVKIILD